MIDIENTKFFFKYSFFVPNMKDFKGRIEIHGWAKIKSMFWHERLLSAPVTTFYARHAAPIFYSTYRHPYYAYFTYHPLKTEHTALL